MQILSNQQHVLSGKRRLADPYVSLVAARMRPRTLILLAANQQQVDQDDILDTGERRFRAIRDTFQFE